MLTRRHLLQQVGGGVSLAALSGMLNSRGLWAGEGANPLAPKPGHFPVKAKAVIWLFMNGGPSQMDTFDYKPDLEKRDGVALAGFDKDTGFFPGEVGPLKKSPFTFAQYGRSGSWVSDLFPEMAKQVDKMAFMHGCWTDSNNHAPALLKMNSGMARMGFPSLGAWLTYGIGSVGRDLPPFVVMTDPKGRGVPKGHSANWSAGFLPSIYQGTALRPKGEAIADLNRPGGIDAVSQRAQLDLLGKFDQRLARGDSELEARSESFELAYRMQTSAPEALNIDAEPAHIREMYGINDKNSEQYGRQCLTARRLIEKGVRCVQIYSGGMDNDNSWDAHKDVVANHRGFASETDKPIAGLLADLAQRGLLDETLVIWGGEFGRLPVAQGKGRDHNPHAFTTWFAGGGVKAGVHHGATDEIGYKAVEGRVSVHDLHATILHLMGMDHQRLTYHFNGRDYRLTDVEGKVVKAVLA